jgi:hypothetical protein
MVGLLKALVYGAGGMAVVGLAALVALQERLVYVPVLPGLARAYSITPSRLRLVYEDVWLRAADGVRLHSWFIRHSPTCRGKHHPVPNPPQPLPVWSVGPPPRPMRRSVSVVFSLLGEFSQWIFSRLDWKALF